MNKHLNLFRFYTATDREHQLENDLTRALAITLMENNLFLHESLKEILEKEDFESLSNQDLATSSLQISIQGMTKQLQHFDKVYAVSVSGAPVDLEFEDNHEGYINTEIPDMVIQINAIEKTVNPRITIIFEVKRNEQDTGQQLFEQAVSIFRNNNDEWDFHEFKKNFINENKLKGVDWNWKKVMKTASRVQSFLNFTQNSSKIVDDFIDLIRQHNVSWLPQYSLHITPASSNYKIMERIKDAFRYKYGEDRLIHSDRLGIMLPETPWANELLVYNEELNNNTKPAILFLVFPGNTKAQGRSIFLKNDFKEIKNQISVKNKLYNVEKSYHIKFTSWQSYFTSIDFNDDDLLEGKLIYTKNNFLKIAGRKKKGDNNWQDLQLFFDEYFKSEFNWRKNCDWINKLEKSQRSQVDVSFSFRCSVSIPYEEFKKVDKDVNDLQELGNLLDEIKNQLQTII